MRIDHVSNHIRIGEFRVVKNRKRKRLLEKRGENIWWQSELNAWVWDFWKLPF